MTGDLVERIRSALDEAEKVARGADWGPWEVGPSFGARDNRVYVRREGDLIDSIGNCVIAGQVSNMPQFRQNAIFIAANNPAVVLRTIQAHRDILDEFTGAAEWDAELRAQGKHAEAELYNRYAGAMLVAVRALASIYFPEGTPDADVDL